MAIGSAYLLGFRLPENFRTPYLSLGPREFWQRWHITLSTWIRDYLYIPLGGSRGGAVRAALVLVGTMTLAGLWHGASWTFVAWGFCWGIYIWLGRIAGKRIALPWLVAWLCHMGIVVTLWVLFRAPSIGEAADYLAVMFGLEGGAVAAGNFHKESGVIFGLLPLAVLSMVAHWGERRLSGRGILLWLRRWDGWFLYGVLAALPVCMIMVQREDLSPFIYFRF